MMTLEDGLIWWLHMAGCAKPCEYVARCDGTVLQTCFLGVDQLFGSGESEVDCPTTGNAECVETAPDVAFCARTATATCTAGESFCDGTDAVTCNDQGFEVAKDCTGQVGPTCVVNGDAEAVCGIDPVALCSSADFERRCAGDQLVACLDGVEATLTCADDRVCRVEAGEAGCRESD